MTSDNMQNNIPLSEYDKSAVDIANSVIGRLTQLHRARESAAPKPASDLLFHYTTADGLKGILENDELWATSAYYLNDANEIYYGCGLFKAALDEWIKKNTCSEKSFSLLMARKLREWFGERLLPKRVILPIYVACFCEEDNLLSQWRAYGQSGGYSLGFSAPVADYVGQGFKPEPTTYTSKWIKVEYDREAQSRRCSAILDATLPIFDDPGTEEAVRAVSEHPLVGFSKIFEALNDMIMEAIVGFKSEAFSVEREWRLVVRRREIVMPGTDDGGKNQVPVYFRSARGTLIPYVKLVPMDSVKKLPLMSVRSGPTHDEMTAAVALSMMLRKFGYSARIHASYIPVRF